MFQNVNKSALFLVNLLTGISDGLLLPLLPCILVMRWLDDDPWKIVCIGLLITLVAGLVYGIARYSGELNEIRHNHPDLSRHNDAKEERLLHVIGIEPSLTTNLMKQMDSEKDQWLAEVKENEMGWHKLDQQRALKSGLETASGLWLGGVMVSLLFFIPNFTVEHLTLMFGSIFVMVFLFGFLKAKLVMRSPVNTAIIELAKALALTACGFFILNFFLTGGN